MNVNGCYVDDYSRDNRGRKKTAWFPAFCRQDNGGDEELTI
jgi:hypothetical protein